MNMPSECRIASIAPNHALILPNDANPGRIQFSERTGSWASMPPTIMDREFIDLWTRIPRFIGRLSTSASSHHDLSLAAFITNIAGSDFRYTQGLVRADLPVSLSSSASRGSSAFGACLRARIGSFLPALAAFAATPCDDIGEIIAAVIVG